MKLIAIGIGGIAIMSVVGFLLSLKAVDERTDCPVGDIDGIRIEGGAVNLHVEAEAGSDRVRLHLHGKTMHELGLSTELEERVLVARIERPAKTPLYEKVVLDLFVPAGAASRLSIAAVSTSGNVDIDSMSFASLSRSSSTGRLRCRALQAERVSIQTGSGSVAIGALEAARLEMNGTSANLEIDEYSVREGVVTTTSGNVSMKRAVGSLSTESRSGNVFVAYAAFEEAEASIVTVSGNARLELPADAEFSVDARSEGGHVSSGFTLTGSETVDEKHLVGQVGSTSSTVSIRTSTGNVEISKT